MRPRPSRRTAISEVIGTVLVSAMTIIAGAAIFGYVNGQASASAQAYGGNVAGSVNALNEKFAVVDMSFGASSVTIWVYNNGQMGLSLLQIRLYNTTGPSGHGINLLYNFTVSASTKTDYFYDLRSSQASKCKLSASTPTNYEPQGTVSGFSEGISTTRVIQLSFPSSTSPSCPSYGQGWNPGSVYTVTVVGTNGNSATFYQVK